MSKLERFSFLDAFLRTFYSNRWRGENVSTAEVEATVSNFLELQVKQGISGINGTGELLVSLMSTILNYRMLVPTESRFRGLKEGRE